MSIGRVRTRFTRDTEKIGMSTKRRRSVEKESIEWSYYMTMHLPLGPFVCVASATRATSLKTSVTPRLCLEEHSAAVLQIRKL